MSPVCSDAVCLHAYRPTTIARGHDTSEGHTGTCQFNKMAPPTTFTKKSVETTLMAVTTNRKRGVMFLALDTTPAIMGP